MITKINMSCSSPFPHKTNKKNKRTQKNLLQERLMEIVVKAMLIRYGKQSPLSALAQCFVNSSIHPDLLSLKVAPIFYHSQ